MFDTKIKHKLKKAFSKIKEEFEDHLGAINENTTEIQTNSELLQELSQKIDHVSQRLDKIEMALFQKTEKTSPISLSLPEKQIFLTVYTEEMPLSYDEIAQKSSLPLAVVQENLSSLLEKGIPLTKSYFNNKPYFKLDKKFREIQTKTNIINLSLKSYIPNK